MIQNGLPDAWRVAVENEPSPREEMYLLREAAELLVEGGWKIMVMHSTHSTDNAKNWISLELTPTTTPKNYVTKADLYRSLSLKENSPNFEPMALVMAIFGVLLAIVGVFMAIDGIFAAITETSLPEQSAIRGIENVAEYGLGFVIFALGLLLYGVSGLLRKK